MKEDNSSGNNKMENFLESALESFPNFCFKSPTKNKNAINIDSLPMS